MSFLDCNGALIPYAYEAWRDEGRDKQSKHTVHRNIILYYIVPIVARDQDHGA